MDIIIGFNIISIIFTVLIAIFYYSKAKVNNEENEIYKVLLIVNVFAIIFEFLCIILAGRQPEIGDKVQESLPVMIICKGYLLVVFIWMMLFIRYIYIISFDKTSKFALFCSKPIIRKAIQLIMIVGVILTTFLPIYFYNDGKLAYTWGPATNLAVMPIVFSLFFSLFAFFSNKRKDRVKKFAPMFLFAFEFGIIIFCRSFNPSIQLIATSLTVTTILMYFTIENPDLKMVNELYKNKNIMEQTYEDKSNFLFEITQTIKEPLLNITNICNEVQSSKKMVDYKEGLYKVKEYSKELDFVLNNILDTNNLNTNLIKFIENKYNVERLFDEIVSRVNSTIPKDVKFTSSITHNIPVLYGDSIKLKQVIMSLLQNSVKHTKKGFIDFEIDTIERYDAIRLIVTIRDSSEGMSIDKINEVLTMTGDLDVHDVEALEQSHINMKLCQKIIKLLGGNMLIKSTEGQGSEILLVVDQKVADIKKNEVDTYESYTSFTKNVMVINQDKKYETLMKNKFRDNNINASFLLNGNDLLDKIKSGRRYDYIIVGDEMKGINGISLLQELNKIKDFKIPVIIIIDEQKEKIAKHFLEEGFANYILTSNFDEDLDAIINKY